MRKVPYRRKPKLLPLGILAVLMLLPVAVVALAKPNATLAGSYSGDVAFGKLELKLEPEGSATLRLHESAPDGSLTRERDFIRWAALGPLVLLKNAGQTDFFWYEEHRAGKGAAIHRLVGFGKDRVGHSILWRD